MRQAGLCLIDDDAAVLDSLSSLLSGQGYEVRAFSSAEEFLTELDGGYQPACIISDVRLNGLSGLELQTELQKRRVRSPLILITGHGQISMAVKAIKAGAADFIEKPFDVAALAEAIERSLEAAGRQAEVERSREALVARVGQLSQRQRQVMDLVVRGYSSKEIAMELGISPRTVETYRLWIMERTGARNLAELVRMATQLEASVTES